MRKLHETRIELSICGGIHRPRNMFFFPRKAYASPILGIEPHGHRLPVWIQIVMPKYCDMILMDGLYAKEEARKATAKSFFSSSEHRISEYSVAFSELLSS